MKLPSPITDELARFRTLPKWRRRLLLGLLIFGALYLAWCRWWPKPPNPDTYAPARTAPPVAGLVKVPLPARQILAYPKAAAVRKLKLTPAESGSRAEAIINASDIPPSRHGSRAVTFMNLSTGESRTAFKQLPAPLLSLERKNELGGGVDVSTRRGETWNIYYRRDVLQMKGLIVSGRAEVSGSIAASTSPELKAGIQTRFEW